MLPHVIRVELNLSELVGITTQVHIGETAPVQVLKGKGGHPLSCPLSQVSNRRISRMKNL
jgi:hypothetical protein